MCIFYDILEKELYGFIKIVERLIKESEALYNMSVRVKGLLSDRLMSRMERFYLSSDNAIKLTDVMADMTFESTDAFIDFESRNHHYLPVMHILGSITSVKLPKMDEFDGSYPFDISSIIFDDADKPYLMKDCRYYPTPKEIGYLAESAGLYTKHFSMPSVLQTNTYELPVKTDITIVPPVLSEQEDVAMAPIVYVKLKGTGVTKKTDKLLARYDIDFEDGVEMYALTEESSGYSNPSLIEYIPAVELENEVESDKGYDTSMSYWAEQFDVQNQMESEDSLENTQGYELTQEIQTVDDKRLQMHAENVLRRIKEHQLEKTEQREMSKSPIVDVVVDTKSDTLESMKEDVLESTTAHVSERMDEGQPTMKQVDDFESMFTDDSKEEDAIDTSKLDNADDFTLNDPVFTEYDASNYGETFDEMYESRDVNEARSVPEETLDVVDTSVSDDTNAILRDKQISSDVSQDVVETETESLLDDDSVALEDVAGGDVRDAKEQVKVNEARMTEMNRESGMDKQAEPVEQSVKKSEKTIGERRHNGQDSGITSCFDDMSESCDDNDDRELD